MDTKLKKSKPFLSWFCFFTGLSIISFMLIFGIIVFSGNYLSLDDINDVYCSEFKESSFFKRNVTNLFINLANALTNDYEAEDGSYEGIGSDALFNMLDQEGDNLIYYASNSVSGKSYTNGKSIIKIVNNGIESYPDGYDYYLHFDGNNLSGMIGEKSLNVNDNVYKNLHIWRYYDKDSKLVKDIFNWKIWLFVKKDLVQNPYGSSTLYSYQQNMNSLKWMLPVLSVIFLIGILLMVISIIKRKQKHELDARLASYTGSLWIEVKIILTIIVFMFFTSLNISFSRYRLTENAIPIVFLGILAWWSYLMAVDLIINKRKVFTHNIINSAIKKYMAFERMKPLQKGLVIRFYALLCSELLLMLLAIVMLIVFESKYSIIPFIIIATICIYLLYRYLRRFKNTVNDIGHVVNQIEEIKNGNMHERHIIMPGADLFPAQDGLNRIQEGMSSIIDEKMRSERMKVELITNVSHDLKTPLTSIISYVDLLSKEEELPQHVKDYVSILSQKSERLKTLIQDLFDLSKVNSGNVEIEHEMLDLCKVVRQTLGEMDEDISKSGLVFKVKIPEEAIHIMSDGTKLYRVFQNLISNTLKYSLAGSRVFVDVSAESGKAKAVIKNTANYEMNFDESEIVERFVRADEARTTEGTGLGLAIAKSFTQACGGQLAVKVDGDLFKATVIFNTCD